MPTIIQSAIALLRQLTELDIQNNWLFTDTDIDINNLEKIGINDDWQKGKVNEKNYLIWEKGSKVRWFLHKLTIPKSLNHDYPVKGLNLRLFLTWWAESAQIFINGNLVGEGDLFDSSCRLLVAENISENQEFWLSLRLVSPSHDIGGLMVSRQVYETNSNNIDPSFFANELSVLARYIDNFYPDKKTELENIVRQLNWDYLSNQDLFHQELQRIRQQLLPLSNYIKERQFNLLGHAHLDMAWLWTIEETYTVAKRTFNSVLNLQEKYHYLTFGHTTAYLYQWIESHDSILFHQIQQSVTNRQWEILGGMWVEPEVNLIRGESLIRQLLYGQKYFYSQFGKYNSVAWLPDTFGFPWQLPQILRQAEIKYFVTGKLHWNDRTRFPYGCFYWQSPDGSEIFSAMSPPNVAGVMDTNPLTMTNYSVDWEKQTGLKEIFWLPGVGDHGGGPTRDMLEVAKRYDKSPFFPQIKFTTAQEYLDKISKIYPEKLPRWNSELYLELHRGCYTTHGDQKYYNRYSEKLLYLAELFTTIATILKIQFSQDNQLNGEIQQRIEDNWKKILLNQFHDILPGTSITPVFTYANQLYHEVINDTQDILSNAFSAIAQYIKHPEWVSNEYEKIVIFNGLNWQRTDLIELDTKGKYYQVYDNNQEEIITQISHEGKLLFSAEKIEGVGYKSFYLFPKQEATVKERKIFKDYQLSNDYLQVTIDEITGNLSSVYDVINQREILDKQGNELQLFKDEGQYWDAWNIDPNYENHRLENTQLKSIQWLEKGKLRQIIRVVKTFHKSEFIQDYILTINSPILTIKNQVDWQEEYTLLKVNFPLTIESNFVTYDIACATIPRTTKPETEAEKAQWEVYGHHFADLSDNNYGVSLLNDCKYGYDAKPNQIRLSLLRSPKWPDPKCDTEGTLWVGSKKLHQFSYGLYAHKGDWKEGDTVRKGYEFNLPLSAFWVKNKSELGLLPPEKKLIDLSGDNLILMALKQGEDRENNFILRGYEWRGKSIDFDLNNSLNLQPEKRVNILENEEKNNSHKIKPYQIFTFDMSVRR